MPRPVFAVLAALVAVSCAALVVSAQAVDDARLQPFSYDQLMATTPDARESYAPFGYNRDGSDSVVAPPVLMEQAAFVDPAAVFAAQQAQQMQQQQAMAQHLAMLEQRKAQAEAETALVESEMGIKPHGAAEEEETEEQEDDAQEEQPAESASGEMRFVETKQTPTPVGGATTPTSTVPPKPTAPCRGSGKACSVKFSEPLQFTGVVVDKLDDAATGAAAGGSAASTPEPSIVLSSNEEIANAQKQFYAKFEEFKKDQAWVDKVRDIVVTYQQKLRAVDASVRSQKRSLNAERRRIVGMIKRDKQTKLEAELKLALESLKKLEGTSTTLSSKINELSSTKSGLRETIGRISAALAANGLPVNTPGAIPTDTANPDLIVIKQNGVASSTLSTKSGKSLIETANAVEHTRNFFDGLNNALEAHDKARRAAGHADPIAAAVATDPEVDDALSKLRRDFATMA